MKNLTEISYQKILETCGQKGIYLAKNKLSHPTKKCFKDSLDFEGTGEEGIVQGTSWCFFLALSDSEKFVTQTIEKIIPGDCVEESNINQFEQGKICRFKAGDPWIFVAKVMGYAMINESYWLVLEDKLGNQLFFLISGRSNEVSFLKIHSNQKNLPTF
jgi:hypothetical protein